MYAERFGKPRWGDKTPIYAFHLASIEALLPEARFVQIVRDGRDVAVSLRRQWFSPGHEISVQARYWRDIVTAARGQGAACRHYLEVRYEDLLADPESVLRRTCAFLALDYEAGMVRYHERAAERLQEHAARVRGDGSVQVSREQRFQQQAGARRPPDLSRIGTWKDALSEDECRQFQAIAGSLLKDLGY